MMQTKNKNIIELLGLESLPVEKQVEIIGRATELVESRAARRLLNTLSQEHHDALTNLIDKDDDEALKSFLSGHNIDLERVIEEEVEKVKGELLTAVEGV